MVELLLVKVLVRLLMSRNTVVPVVTIHQRLALQQAIHSTSKASVLKLTVMLTMISPVLLLAMALLTILSHSAHDHILYI
jgi:hypothetical protein